jgi:hypothetical protein
VWGIVLENMKIVYYTSGITGAGRLVLGMSIGNALIRKGIRCDYTIVHTSPVQHLAGDFHNIKIPLENEIELSAKNYHTSVLYKTLTKLRPDILIVNHMWFAIVNFSNELKCKKIYLSDHAYDRHFKMPLPEGELVFNKDQYDRVLAIEPFTSFMPMEMINPLVIRNRDEILTREKALDRLDIDGLRKVALYSFSGNPGDYEENLEKYSYLEKEYDVLRLSLYGDYLFPVVDYYNAFDLIVCGGGYNNVWAAVYFDKKAIFEPAQLLFSNHEIRIKASENFRFDINGADQLVDIINAM